MCDSAVATSTHSASDPLELAELLTQTRRSRSRTRGVSWPWGTATSLSGRRAPAGRATRRLGSARHPGCRVAERTRAIGPLGSRPGWGGRIPFTLWVDNDHIAVARRGSGRMDVRPEPRWVVHEPRPGRLNRCAASRRPIAKSFAKLALGRKLSLRTKEAITPSSKNAAALSQVSATRLPSRRCSSFDFFMADAPASGLGVEPLG
jgi:hypothetical protein